MRKSFDTLFAHLSRILTWTSLIVAGASGWMSFLTYREFMAGTGLNPVIALVTAGIAAIACGVILHFIFVAILGGIPLVDRLSRQRFLPLIGGLMLLVAMFSTYTNVITTAGNEALRIHDARTIDALIARSADLQAAGHSGGQLVPALTSHADRLQASADCEAAKGCLSGTPGRGDLSDALVSASDKARTIASTLAQGQANVTAMIDALNESLARGDELAVRGHIAHLRGIIPIDAMRATATTFRADLGIVGTARNAALRARQNEAIATIQRDLGALASELDRTASRLSEQLASFEVPERQTITKARAILAYAGQLIPQIALGAAIDWVLILGAFFMATLRDVMPRPEDDVSDISLADARRIRRELTKLLREIDTGENPPPSPSLAKANDPARKAGKVMSSADKPKDLAA
ncbi:hypothetical protein GC173_02910 [bacterium]|nr:hypothetical protein [bacterium]